MKHDCWKLLYACHSNVAAKNKVREVYISIVFHIVRSMGLEDNNCADKDVIGLSFSDLQRKLSLTGKLSFQRKTFVRLGSQRNSQVLQLMESVEDPLWQSRQLVAVENPACDRFVNKAMKWANRIASLLLVAKTDAGSDVILLLCRSLSAFCQHQRHRAAHTNMRVTLGKRVNVCHWILILGQRTSCLHG